MADTPNVLRVRVDMDTDEVRAALIRAKADAWDEGYIAGSSDTHDDGLYGYTDNPYRPEEASA